jgi:hypothetical protein
VVVVLVRAAAASTDWEANSRLVVVEVSRRPINGGRTEAFCRFFVVVWWRWVALLCLPLLRSAAPAVILLVGSISLGCC